MKKVFFLCLTSLLMLIPVLSQDYENAGMDYTSAIMKKTAPERISAFKDYIKKYPDIAKKFTKLAYYQLTLSYFQNKEYSAAVKIGVKTLNFSDLEDGVMLRLNLVLANCYGIKSHSIYNKEKALKYTNRAITQANTTGDKEALETAKKLKKDLTGPPPKKISPEQKIKMLYQDASYREAISYYKSLGTSEKSDPAIKETYANALFKAKLYDSALEEFKALYDSEKKGIIAYRLGDVYYSKAKKNKKYLDSSIAYYLEASILYKNEKNRNNSKISLDKAKYQLFSKYNYHAKIKKYNESLARQKSSAEQNEREIRRLKLELRRHQRYLRKTYPDMEPPAYELEKSEKLERKIRILEQGGSLESSDEGAKLKDEKSRIEKEFKDLIRKAEDRLKQD